VSAFTLVDFIRESNRIEGILREPTATEVDAHKVLLSRRNVSSVHLETFVAAIQPGARVRRVPGMDVRVGRYIAPSGGPEIESALETLLSYANSRHLHAYTMHIEYETLHPFTDGNGRSGRAIWLLMMGGIKNVPLGFLHTFYYQTLGNTR